MFISHQADYTRRERKIKLVGYAVFGIMSLGMLGSSISSANESSLPNGPAIMKNIATAGVQIMGACPARIWPGYDWSTLIFLQTTDNKGLVLSGTDKKITEADISHIPKDVLESVYGFFRSEVQLR